MTNMQIQDNFDAVKKTKEEKQKFKQLVSETKENIKTDKSFDISKLPEKSQKLLKERTGYKPKLRESIDKIKPDPNKESNVTIFL
jgi:hypothetical protein